MSDLSKVRPSLRAGEVFTSFPREYYLSPEWFEREMELVFSRQWLYAGHESEIPHAGDFMLREVGDESILITRGADQLHAMFNVCRHRGAQLCQQSKGNARKFVCPYHRWTYDLDGRLTAAPAMPDTFEPEHYPLFRAHVRSWNGMVFINLSEDTPEPLDQILKPAEVSFARFDVGTCKVAHTITYSIVANWKLVLDNFMECYHCPGTHPEFCRTFDLKRNPGGVLETCDSLLDFGDFMLKPGAKSSTMSGEPVCRRLMGSLTEDDLPASVALTFRPTSSAILFGDYGIVFDFQPVSPAETRVRCQWLVAGDAEQGRDYDVEPVIALWDITNRQDWILCEITQKGVRSRHFVPGPNCLEQEPAVEVFRSSYLAMMGESC
jgi:Rieske 2Fe-2S family protein